MVAEGISSLPAACHNPAPSPGRCPPWRIVLFMVPSSPSGDRHECRTPLAGTRELADDAAADVSDGEEEGQAAGSKPEKATSSFFADLSNAESVALTFTDVSTDEGHGEEGHSSDDDEYSSAATEFSRRKGRGRGRNQSEGPTRRGRGDVDITVGGETHRIWRAAAID